MVGLEKAFAEYLYSSQKIALFENRALGLVSAPRETEATFRARCHKEAAEQAREELERLRKANETLQERLERMEKK